MNVIAGSWLIASVCIVLMTVMSSTIFAVCGSSSLTHVPDCAVLREAEHRAGHRQRRLPHRLRDALALADRVGNLRALELRELRLVVERLELRRSARLVQEDHALRLRREMRKAGEAPGLRIARPCWPVRPTAAPIRAATRAPRRRCRGPSARTTAAGSGAARVRPMACASRVSGSRHCLVMVSSRFRIVLATVVHAASSAHVRVGFRGDSPTLSNAAPRCRSRRNDGQLPREQRPQHRRLVRRRPAGGGEAEGVLDALRLVRAAFDDRALGQRPRRFDIRRVVQQHERLQRRVGQRAAGPCTSRDRARRRSPSTPAARCASRTCTCRAGRDPCRGSARRPARRSPRRTPSPPTAPAVDTGNTLGPPISPLSRPLAASAVSRIISAGRRMRGARASSRFSGILLEERRRHLRRLAIGRRRDDQPLHRAHVPAGADELGGEPVEQLRMDRRLPLHAEILLRLDDADGRSTICQNRLTATRAVSGCAGSTSHFARVSRLSGASFGSGGSIAGTPGCTFSVWLR